MQEVENINSELMVLSDMLARLRDGELDAALEDDLALKQTVWQRTQDQKEMQARFDYLNSLLDWWREQTGYIFAHVGGPTVSGFRSPSADGPPQATAVAQNWQSAESLLRKLAHQPLERALQIWTDSLIGRGMLNQEDAAGVVFDPPRDEYRDRKQAEDRERKAQFQADLERVLQKVEQVATARGRHPGLPRRQAECLWNRRFNERYRDRQLLGEYIRALSDERLLPPSYAAMRSAAEAVRGLLGG